MSSFDDACLVVKEHEGGFSNDPDDHGGATNFGITQADLSAFRLYKVSEKEVAALTFDEAKLIYKKFYWDRLLLDEVHDPRLQTLFLDQAMLSGVVGCCVRIQRAVGTEQDGIMGQQTLAAINRANPALLAKKFLIELQNHYIDIVVNDPTQLKFIKGWIARTQDLMMI